MSAGRLRKRDPDSTTYVGAIETAEEFGKRIYWRKSGKRILEAWDHGWSRAESAEFRRGDGADFALPADESRSARRLGARNVVGNSRPSAASKRSGA